MVKFIKDLLFFLLFAIAGYFILLIIWGEWSPKLFQKNLNYPRGGYGHLYTRIKEINHYDTVDILFLGSSHSYRGFDPIFFTKKGYKTFNLGSSAQTPIQTNVLLKKYLQVLNPKLVIYEVFPGTLTMDGVESAVDIISNDEIDSLTWKMVLQLNHVKVYNSLIYSYYNQKFKNDKDFTEPKVKKNSDEYISGGFVRRKVSHYSPKDEDVKEKKWKMRKEQIAAFEENISILKKENINYVLVQAPYPPIVYNSYINNTEIDIFFNHYGAYFNFNQLLILSDSMYFYDHSHLNQLGVDKFNNFLIKKLNL